GAGAPERLRVQRDDDAAGRVDLDARALRAARGRELGLVEPEPELGGAEHAALLRGNYANADVTALCARLVAHALPMAVVDLVEEPREDGLVVAAVVDVPRRRAVGELVRRDEVPAPDLDPVHAEVA